MFWTKEDLDPINELVVDVFGKQGRMSPKPKFPDCEIHSTKYGKLWYGDVDTSEELGPKLQELQKALENVGTPDSVYAIVEGERKIVV